MTDDVEQPPDTFFVDTCLGTIHVPGGLREAGAQVVCLTDAFEHDVRDEIWLPTVGANGWAVLTKDKWIRRRANELGALQNAGVGAFILAAKGLNGQQMAAAFVAALPRMRRFLRTYARGDGHFFVARVSPSGDVELTHGGTRKASIRRDS